MCSDRYPNKKQIVQTLWNLTWVSELVPTSRSTSEPTARNDKEVVVVALVGTGQPIDQFYVDISGSEMVRISRFRTRAGISI